MHASAVAAARAGYRCETAACGHYEWTREPGIPETCGGCDVRAMRAESEAWWAAYHADHGMKPCARCRQMTTRDNATCYECRIMLARGNR